VFTLQPYIIGHPFEFKSIAIVVYYMIANWFWVFVL